METGQTVGQSKEYKIYVYYLSTSGMDNSEVHTTIMKVSKDITESGIFQALGSVCLVLPILGEGRLECINPIYITNEELIKKNTLLLEELHGHIKFQLDQNK